MPEPIILSIATGKIAKEHLHTDKQGRHYIQCVIWPNKDGKDQYGNEFYITQSVSKEARQQGVKGPIIGNGKFMPNRKSPAETAAPAKRPIPDDDGDPVPF